ncbi:hypothetical protein HDV05_003674 [Chytridiales sp. JEL 0842]|nr:hypothetical protein HDV05_003674 [Chytridiales sp. JEL 0842]
MADHEDHVAPANNLQENGTNNDPFYLKLIRKANQGRNDADANAIVIQEEVDPENQDAANVEMAIGNEQDLDPDYDDYFYLPDDYPESHITEAYRTIYTAEDVNKLDRTGTMSFEDFAKLAFLMIRYRAVDNETFKEILKHVPILERDPDTGDTFLHAAIREDNAENVETLFGHYDCALDTSFMFTTNKDDLTPTELAVKLKRWDIFEYLLHVIRSWLLSTDALISSMKKCLQIRHDLDDEVWYVPELEAVIRTMELQKAFNSTDANRVTVEALRAELESLSWWEERHIFGWSNQDLNNIFSYLRRLAESNNSNAAATAVWIFNELNVSAIPPPSNRYYETLADYAVHAYNYKVLKNEEEPGSPTVDYILYRHLRTWDGTVSAFEKRCEECPKKLSPQAEFFMESFKTSNLAMLNALTDRYQTDGAFVIPRLDLLVKANRVDVLDWLLDRNFIDLNEPVVEKEDDDVDDLEDIDAEFKDGDCPICYSKLRNPVELDCNHSFCRRCLNELHQRDALMNAALRCPICRREKMAPVSLNVVGKLIHYLRIVAPWLNYQDGATMAEVLFGYAIGCGAIRVFDWLIEKCNFDVTKPRYAENENAFHIAVLRKNLISPKWLAARGFLSLVYLKDDNGVSAADLIFQDASKAAERMVELVFNSDPQLMPANWLELAENSPNSAVQALVKHLEATRKWTMFQKTYNSQSFDQFKSILKELWSTENFKVKFELQTFLLENNRFDLIWLSSVSDDFPDITEDILDTISPDELDKSSTSDIYAAKLLLCSTIRSIILQANDVLLQAQIENGDLELYKKAARLYKVQLEIMPAEFKRFNFERFAFTVDDTISEGLTILDYSFVNNRLDIATWLLSQEGLPIRDMKEFLLKNRSVYDSSRTLTLEMLKFWIGQFEANEIPLSAFEYLEEETKDDEDETVQGKTCIMLHDFVRKYVFFGCKQQEYVECIAYLLNHASFNNNIYNSNGENALACLIHNGNMSAHVGSQLDSDYAPAPDFDDRIMELAKLLIEKGVSYKLADRRLSKNLMELIWQSGSKVFAPLARYLAFEVGMSMEYLN